MQVDELVTCIADDATYRWLLTRCPSQMPIVGNVYTVSGVNERCEHCSEMHIFVEELDCPIVQGYPSCWFRPSPPANLEKFIEQLLPTPQDVPVTG